jgi:4'-phosphopantetheinyl transferase
LRLPFCSNIRMKDNLAPLPSLMPREVHVWRVGLNRPAAELPLLAECLSADEQRRAARFVRPIDRQRFIVSHAALRTILGGQLKTPAHAVAIAIQPGGKPELANSADVGSLCFNLSHSESVALVALAFDAQLGVDVECIRPLNDAEGLVSRYFAPGEQAAWRALPPHERQAGFFRCWTRKEAYLKAQGVGLSQGLDRFEVSLVADEPPRLLAAEGFPGSNTRWHLRDIPIAEGYLAACAVDWDPDRVVIHDWPA